MTQFIIFIIIGLAGILVGYFLAVRRKARKNAVDRRDEAKDENMRKLREYIAGKETVSNDEAERFLGVSDATAERYLGELEKEGALKQIGKTGRSARYKVV